MLNQPSGTGTIVVVDDDQYLGILLRRVLYEIAPSYHVFVSQHGAGAIVQVESQFVPLVITDYKMPDMDGIEVVKEIKRRSPQTYVVALTGDTDISVRKQFIGAGADEFFEKPASVTQLKAVVLRALAKGTGEGYIW